MTVHTIRPSSAAHLVRLDPSIELDSLRITELWRIMIAMHEPLPDAIQQRAACLSQLLDHVAKARILAALWMDLGGMADPT